MGIGLIKKIFKFKEICEFGFGSAWTLSKHLNMQIIDNRYQNEIQSNLKWTTFSYLKYLWEKKWF